MFSPQQAQQTPPTLGGRLRLAWCRQVLSLPEQPDLPQGSPRGLTGSHLALTSRISWLGGSGTQNRALLPNSPASDVPNIWLTCFAQLNSLLILLSLNTINY